MEKVPNADPPHTASSHTERKQPALEVDQTIIQSLSKDYRVLPTFELKLYEMARVRMYSLRRNSVLGSRWRRYVDNVNGGQSCAYQFPKVEDFHFYNYHNRYVPSQSVLQRTRHCRKLRVGPGVDQFGQMPIPSDMHLRRSNHAPKPATILNRRAAILSTPVAKRI